MFIKTQVPRFVELKALYLSIYFIVELDIWRSLKNRLKSGLKLMQRPIYEAGFSNRVNGDPPFFLSNFVNGPKNIPLQSYL